MIWATQSLKSYAIATKANSFASPILALPSLVLKHNLPAVIHARRSMGGSCNYAKQPCCVEGGGVPCVANSTCSCDETDYTVKCNELPIVFCPTGGGNGKMNSKNKKGKKPKNNMNMRKLR
jgi:hypothetical protein